MIKMPNIDQHIWNLEFLIVDLIKEFEETGSIVIDLNNEGPDAAELGLYDLLDYVCDKYKIDKTCVLIRTSNLLEKHPEYQIIFVYPLCILMEAQKFAKQYDYTHKNFNNIKHFGLFIGRSNWLRLWLSSELFSKYRSQTLQTFLYSSTSDFHKLHLGFDQLVNELQGLCDFQSITNLISMSPVTVEPVDQFPILMPAHLDIAKHYDKFFVELVSETYTSGCSFFPTEKTWRPLLCKTPFMIQGPVDFLKNLRRLGFQTFGEFWDESYDEDGSILGTQTILNNVKMLSAMPIKELQSMYNHMRPILDHNYNTMMELNNESFEIFK